MTKNKIESLTEKQKSRFQEFVQKWTDIGLCTDPANREQAEISINLCYDAAGLKRPEKIIWCGSPLSMAITHTVLKDEKLKANLGDSVGASVWDSVGASVGASVRDSVRDSVYGQHDAGWFSFYSFFREACGLEAETDKLQGLMEGAKNHGWWLPCENVCFVAERHNVLKRDDRGLLHCETGPACAFPDGFEMYYWHGVRVPEEWIKNKGSLSAKDAITWSNVEQRRCACEILGWSNILNILDAKTIDKNKDPQIGELLEVDLPDSGKERFLKVTCGTGRIFALPVPPDVKTALAANAWTYNLDATEYQPEVRT